MAKIHLIYNSKLITLSNGREKEKPIGDLSIKKGGTYFFSLRLDGDYSLWTPRSEIRDNYLDNNGNIIATFEFLPLEYDATENKTNLTLTLKGSVTSTLPVTNFQAQTGQTPTIDNCLTYDLELVDPEDPDNILKIIEPSFVQVTPEVTNGN